ncbi:hypothetical protein Tco_1018635 [Tanacetum coccineum]|uniref:Uncharacterized protein n=1 Tax=Tanacetum coccineum TaxID=301880 RepID=A0ABQ5FWF7_9ASTR
MDLAWSRVTRLCLYCVARVNIVWKLLVHQVIMLRMLKLGKVASETDFWGHVSLLYDFAIMMQDSILWFPPRPGVIRLVSEILVKRSKIPGIAIIEVARFLVCLFGFPKSKLSIPSSYFGKFVIVCHEKVVRIPLEGDGILRVQGERTLGAAKALMNTKIDEPRISDIPVVRDFTDVFSEDLLGLPPASTTFEFRTKTSSGRATPSAKSLYRLAPSEMQELFGKELQDKGLLNILNPLLPNREESEVWEVGMEGVGDALSRKERVKSRRVKGMILTAQSEAFKQEKRKPQKRLHGLDQQMERKGDGSWYSMDRIWILLVGSVMDEAHASRYLVHPGVDKTYYNLRDMYW